MRIKIMQMTLMEEFQNFLENDSDYDMNDDDDNEYDNNVDNNSEIPVSNKDNSYSYDDKSEPDAAPDYDSDFESIHGSDEEQDRNRYPIFNSNKDMENPTLQCRMIFSNFKDFKQAAQNWNIKRGKALRDALWAAAKATTPAQFSARMEEIAAVDLDVAKKILDARERLIVEMLESLRLYLMQRMQLSRDRAKEKWITKKFCPKIIKRLNKNIENAPDCTPFKSNDIHYEVGCPYGEKYIVNLEDRTYSCRKWDLTGIPCPHAISAIWMALKDPVDFVDDCYSMEKYLKCYEPTILPVNGEIDWPKSDCIAPLPPSYENEVVAAATATQESDKENMEKTNRVEPLETTQDYQGSGLHESAEQIELTRPHETTIRNEDIRPRYLNLADVDNGLFDVAFTDNYCQNDGDQSHQKAKKLPASL
ncbi:hypothetical protein ACH5RR_007711 [Cinchona calisaya]|uniref:SWIM-type domain-containing protein n=1 Tax=Cinchona calisaya TaxID=153742 RepID=A0ABD3A9H7_9GENT